MNDSPWLIGADIGGSFTDLSAVNPSSGELVVAKVPTTSGAPERGLDDGLRELVSGVSMTLGALHHGTTILTNALLEGRLAKTALLCTRGFRDVLEMRRLWREYLFGYDWERPPPLVPRALRLEVEERIGPMGEVLQPLNEKQVRALAAKLKQLQVQSVAVAYLFSFRNPHHERRTREILREELAGTTISISSDVMPELHEYERTSTTTINALVSPLISEYISTVEKTLSGHRTAGPLRMIRSDGSLTSAASAAREPVRLLHSGPAAGVVGAVHIGERLAWPNILTLDMGGTSTDVALIWDGRALGTLEFDVLWNTPVRGAHIDIRSIGAGGGSIAGVDEGGLFVGPESAGARPGPVCYGRGGKRSTVTDALLVAGALPPELLGGALRLDRDAAVEALERDLSAFDNYHSAADAVYTLTLHKMAVLMREVTINRGYDPRACVLFCFGGAGGLFAVDLARELEIDRVYVPPAASVFSSLGATFCRVASEATVTLYARAESLSAVTLRRALDDVMSRAVEALTNDGFGVDRVTVDGEFKYRSQPQTLSVELDTEAPDEDVLPLALRRFHQEHTRLYHLERSGEPVDVVMLRAMAMTPETPGWSPKPYRFATSQSDVRTGSRDWFRFGTSLPGVRVIALGALSGAAIKGPLFIEDPYTTIAVPPGAVARLDDLGGLVLELSS
jgi:N-methylhydantoinase A/oxoprolinase/acetone carboxylase beta subunit